MSQFWKPGTEKPRILEDEEGGRLPVYKYRTAILYLVETHATTIVVGETGSGKTTQIPQYLKEAGWADGGRVIACTQPRRLAVQAATMIKFLTDGVLLKEMMDDPLLTKYRPIDLHSGVASGPIQRRRPELRLIISSATIEAKSMSDFFQPSKKHRGLEDHEFVPRKDPAILSVEGRGFNVLVHFVVEPVPDYVQAVVSTVLSIHDQNEEWMYLRDSMYCMTADLGLRTEFNVMNGLIVLPLYSGLPRAEQVGDILSVDLVFSPTPRGKRKVVISTNVAETSLTLEGVVYVVDSGFSKQQFYNPVVFIMVLFLFKSTMGVKNVIAKLYTEEYFVNEMSSVGIPEIQRSKLVSAVIQLKALGIENILGFDWPASPPPEAMIRALEVLYSLGVLDDDAKLTSPVGFQVAEIPLDPMISKMILSSNQLGCSEEIITIAAILSIQSIWISGRGVQKELDEAKLRFAAAEGDHVTFLNVYKGFLKSGKSSQWCHKNFMNYQAMKKVIEIREQLRRTALRLGIVFKSCEGDMLAVRKAVTAGFFANASRLEAFSDNGMYKTVRRSQEVYIHPSSVLFRGFCGVVYYSPSDSGALISGVNPKWVIYHSLVSTDRQYMRNVMTIDPSWLTEAAPQFFQHQRSDPNVH
ncbi:unnamed protein product [Dovyalis caffra]|uniref:RNA helicase n=1 Tax=Dovyalis caffra TaxID=77055 RepID=A0AAV1SJM1_9ROSI|nr:unnamed protein product [Dovyalis caffra]